MGFKSRRSKACDISPEVKRIVYARDGGLCVICHRPGDPNAHYIPRSHGGLGIEENVVTLCRFCHDAFDNGPYRAEFGGAIRDYLSKYYKDWDERKLIYRKGGIL